jgi:hypothetical protein
MTPKQKLLAELGELEARIRQLSDRKWHVKGLLGMRKWPRSRLEFFKRRSRELEKGTRK